MEIRNLLPQYGIFTRFVLRLSFLANQLNTGGCWWRWYAHLGKQNKVTHCDRSPVKWATYTKHQNSCLCINDQTMVRGVSNLAPDMHLKQKSGKHPLVSQYRQSLNLILKMIQNKWVLNNPFQTLSNICHII